MNNISAPASQAPAQGAPWRQRLDARLDRWLTSPGLYRWALGNPIGRWITRRRADALFEVMAGFVHSQVLLACVRLGLFQALLDQPRSLNDLARLTQLAPTALQRLLDSALSLRLIERRSSQLYGLGPLGTPVAAHEGLRQMIEHNALLYRDLHDPLALLNHPEQAGMHAYWPYATDGKARTDVLGDSAQAQAGNAPSQSARYSELMSTSQRFLIDELLMAYPFALHRRVLDVGGGQGGWVTALAQHAPELELMLFDLPPVAALARERIAAAGLAGRITAHGGSFTDDPLPQGADLITLLRVAHDHSDAVVRQLLRAIHEALPPGGHLLLAEPMAQHGGHPAASDPYFHFYLLAMGSGRLRSAAELSALMREAGFADVKPVANPMPLHASILLGCKA